MSSLKDLQTQFQPHTELDWLEKLEKDLKGKPKEKLAWKAFEGLRTEPYYHKQNREALLPETLPGATPYLRSTKVLSNGWLLGQEIYFHKSLKASSKRIQAGLEAGIHDFILMIQGNEDGFHGIPVQNKSDLDTLLNPLIGQESGISISSGLLAPKYLDWLLEWAARHERGPETLFGALDYDPLGQYLASGKLHETLPHLFATISERTEAIQNLAPHYKQLSINGGLFHNTGANPVQEVALTLAMGSEYLHGIEEANGNVSSFIKSIELKLDVGSSFFLEIAKIRAFRLLWSRLLDVFNIEAKPEHLFVKCKTSERNTSVYDPHVNMLRNTTQAMSAVIGGADELVLLPYNKGVREPDAFSYRIARNIHHLLSGESYLDKVVDPAAGSYYVEELTKQIASQAWDQLKQIEGKGGLIKLYESGELRKLVQKSSGDLLNDVDSGRKAMIGLNRYPNRSESALESLQPKTAPVAYEEGASDSPGNWAKEAFKAPISTKPVLEQLVLSEELEKMRLQVEIAVKQGLSLPKIFLLAIGSPTMSKARATFISDFFGVAGLTCIQPNRFESIKDAVIEIEQHLADIVILCSADDEYAERLKELTQGLNKRKPTILIAGNPGEAQEKLEDMGASGFIYRGCSFIKTLAPFLPILK